MKRTAVLLLAAVIAACGGGDPFGAPEPVANPAAAGGRKLSFLYFQQCVQPLLVQRIGSNRCADAGCHDDAAGTGGALRVEPGATAVDPALGADAVRATAMYRNFYSAQGVTVVGAPAQSRLFAKPLLLNVLHGGGQVFAGEDDEPARVLAKWITRPMPQTQDEFSAAGLSLLDPATGACL